MQIKHKDYYEAILQLRPRDKELLNFTLNQVNKDPNVSIAKQIDHKTGYDIYLTSQRFAQQLIRKLRSSFEGTVKISRKLHTTSRVTSKKVYRLTVCFRLNKTIDL